MAHKKSALAKMQKGARTAMRRTPNYFAAWYTGKSIALVVTVAAAAYLVGRNHGAGYVGRW